MKMNSFDPNYGDHSNSDTYSPGFNNKPESSQPAVQSLPSIPKVTATPANKPQLKIAWLEARGQKSGHRTQTRSDEYSIACSAEPTKGYQDSSPVVLKTLLDTFCADIRRTKFKLSTQEESQRDLVGMSNLYQAVIEQLSLFPGTARFFLNKHHSEAGG